MNILTLKQERATAAKKMQAIQAAAERDHRMKTPVERRTFDEACREVDRLTGAIDALESNRGVRSDPGALSHAVMAPSADRDLEFNTAFAKELRDLSSGTSGFGGMFPPEYQQYIWDRLAPQTVALKTGPTVITTDRHSISLPHLTADAAGAWVAENGAISETDPTAETVTVTPTKVAALNKYSREASDDANPSVADLVGKNLMRSIGLAIDLGFFEGTGSSNQPTGLKNTASINAQSMGTNGAAPTNLDFLLTALSTLETANADMSKAVIVVHARTVNELFQLKDSQNRYLMESVTAGGETVRSIEGVPIFTCNQLGITETQGSSSVASSAYVYDASQVLFVKAHDIRLEVSAHPYFDHDQIGVRCIARVGFAVPNAKAVVRIAGIL
jgi:HK97 family phage major capsid protein